LTGDIENGVPFVETFLYYNFVEHCPFQVIVIMQFKKHTFAALPAF
jgi:hypothetical protein